MSVPLILITVTRMLSVPTPLVASPVPVTRATVEMESPVWVSKSLVLEHELLILFVSSPTLVFIKYALNKSNNECVLISSVASSCFPISSQLGHTPLRCQVPD